MPSQDGVRQMISSIITGSSVPKNIISYTSLKNDPTLCQLGGDVIEIHSPVDITVTDGKDNFLGIDSDGNIRRDIPGSSFEVENGHKYVYLPTGDGETYTISLQGSPSLGTGSGTYTLIDEKIVNDQPAGAQIFKDQPVTASFSASLDIVSPTPAIMVNGGAAIAPTFAVSGDALQDALAPVTAATLAGDKGEDGFYHSDVTVNLSAADPAQSGVTPAGIASISYVLDGNATSTVDDSTASITVSDEGSHTLTYFSQDKVGNQETQKTISFVIDKTPPTITADAKTADGQDYVAGNWTNQIVTVHFDCNDGGSGIAVCPADKIISTDGITQAVSGLAADNAGNQSNVSFGPIDIDKVSPEIRFSFDQAQKDLVFSASDNLSGPGATDQGNATVYDKAGNFTKLGFVEKNRAQSLRAQVNGLTYSDGTKADISNVQLAFAWFYGYTPAVPVSLSGLLSLPAMPVTLPKSNTLTFLLQQAKLKDGSFIVTLYTGKNTLVLEYKNKKLALNTYSGLKLIKFATSAGAFGWSY